MKTVQEYRRHAEECRALTKQMTTGDQRDQLLKLAETWDALANQREQSLFASPRGRAPTVSLA
jgi:hypothetical protein